MEKPIITEQALADLDEIWLYIAQDNPEAAGRVIDEMYEAICRLNEMPRMGHVREDLTDQPVRFWGVYSYLVVYRGEQSPIQVVRVLSGYRDLAAILS